MKTCWGIIENDTILIANKVRRNCVRESRAEPSLSRIFSPVIDHLRDWAEISTNMYQTLARSTTGDHGYVSPSWGSQQEISWWDFDAVELKLNAIRFPRQVNIRFYEEFDILFIQPMNRGQGKVSFERRRESLMLMLSDYLANIFITYFKLVSNLISISFTFLHLSGRQPYIGVLAMVLKVSIGNYMSRG